MKKRIGKIAVWTMAVLFVAAGCQRTQVATGSLLGTWTIVVPSMQDGNEYLIIANKYTGDLVDPNTTNNPTGIPENDTTWAESAIAVSVHGESDWLTFSVPALDSTYQYVGAIYSNASPAKTDSPINDWTFIIDPTWQIVYSDTNPLFQGKLKVRNQ
jgi:hypothetical protein